MKPEYYKHEFTTIGMRTCRYYCVTKYSVTGFTLHGNSPRIYSYWRQARTVPYSKQILENIHNNEYSVITEDEYLLAKIN